MTIIMRARWLCVNAADQKVFMKFVWMRRRKLLYAMIVNYNHHRKSEREEMKRMTEFLIKSTIWTIIFQWKLLSKSSFKRQNHFQQKNPLRSYISFHWNLNLNYQIPMAPIPKSIRIRENEHLTTVSSWMNTKKMQFVEQKCTPHSFRMIFF